LILNIDLIIFIICCDVKVFYTIYLFILINIEISRISSTGN
jgi:hypothetical protein